MEVNTLDFDLFSESAKAFINMSLGSEGYKDLKEDFKSYSSLQIENENLRAEVESLKEDPLFKSKYENLGKEFRKVAAERDSLTAQKLEFVRMSEEYNRMKEKYQQLNSQLSTYENLLENAKAKSKDPWAPLESLYQAFKDSLDQSGIDIRRIPMLISIQFVLDDSSHRGVSFTFRRTSATKWDKVSQRN